MATKVSEIVSKVRFALTDAGSSGGERFPLPVLFSLITDGLKDIASKKPQQVAQRSSMILANSTQQTVPAEAEVFLYATRNKGNSKIDLDLTPKANPSGTGATTNAPAVNGDTGRIRLTATEANYEFLPGTSFGAAILPASLSVMDNTDPEWYTAAASGTIIHAMADPIDQKKFFVYPKPLATPDENDGTGSATLFYSYTGDPADLYPTIEVAYVPKIVPITAMDEDLPFVQAFDTSLIQYVCYRAMQADSEADANGAMSTSFYNQYIATLDAPGAFIETTLGKKLGKGV